MTFTSLGTGGEYKHKLTAQELPQHGHQMFFNVGGDRTAPAWMLMPPGSGSNSYSQVGSSAMSRLRGAVKEIGVWNGSAFNEVTVDQSHNNTQPWIAVYFWRRTS